MVRPLILRFAVASAVAAAAACVVHDPGPGGGADGAPTAAEAPPCPATQGQLVLERVNEIRTGRGLRRLAPDPALAQAAAAHTADQAARGPSGVGHVGSDDSAPGERVAAAGYDWVLVAENVAAGPASPVDVVRGWMNSPPHRSTILSPEAVHAGIGYVHRLDTDPSHYWTLVVAAPRPGTGAGAGGCHP